VCTCVQLKADEKKEEEPSFKAFGGKGYSLRG
jgi:hypothetical protein